MPSEIDYSKINNLSKEAKKKLNKIKPFSLGTAIRTIAGINQTDIQVLIYNLRKNGFWN